MYEILIKASAEKEIRRLSPQMRERITSVILALRDDLRPSGVRRLKGRVEEGWRIRVGDYRVLYRVDDELRQVTIYRVGHRREVYRL